MDDLVPVIYKNEERNETLLSTLDEKSIFDYLSNSNVRWKKFSWTHFFENLDEWVNVSRPVTEQELNGRIVILDFFTYCCINCMHILPFLKRLERRFSEGDSKLIIIGVHSPKFPNEKSLKNVMNAIRRDRIEHPVVSDPNFRIWHLLNVNCWPTLAMFAPDGTLIFWMEGENRMPFLEQLVTNVLKFYDQRSQLNNFTNGLPISLEKNERFYDTTFRGDMDQKFGAPTLKFPSKLALSPSGELLAVSDSGNNRVVITKVEDGKIEYIIGAQRCEENKDGDFETASFKNPQGLCWFGERIVLLADTDNHVIKKIDLSNRRVTTVAGVSKQGQDFLGGKMANEQEISSPWDVLVADIDAGKFALFIAAAGTHQIWIMSLNEDLTIGKRRFEVNKLYAFAGSGQEAARNNSYPQQAAFAQPSGLSFDDDKKILYVADSESSAIRMIDVKNGGAVKHVVGGNRDPTNLFAFGDVDGAGYEAKLQHPLAVAFCKENGNLYIADSYNHKLKIIESSKNCRTISLNFSEVSQKNFNEPAGLAVAFPNLFVADTNNHRILKVDLSNFCVHEVIFSPKEVEKRINKDIIDGICDGKVCYRTLPNS